jgi:hypothetical protein
MTTAKQQATGEQDFLAVWDSEAPDGTEVRAARKRLSALRIKSDQDDQSRIDQYTEAYNEEAK